MTHAAANVPSLVTTPEPSLRIHFASLPPPPSVLLPPHLLIEAETPLRSSSDTLPSQAPDATPAHSPGRTSDDLLTCVRILAASTIVTTLFSLFGWLVITHVYARVHPTRPVYLELFFCASAAGGALLGAFLGLAICVFCAVRHRWQTGAGPNGGEEAVFPPLHALSAANALLCISLVLVGVAFSAVVGMVLLPGTTTDELGLHEAAVLGGLCAIPGGLGLVCCGYCHFRSLARRKRSEISGGVLDEKV